MVHGISYCNACLQYFGRGEKGYVCSQKCGSRLLLHEDCAEAPRKIRHAMHPQHTLAQQYYSRRDRETRCSICRSQVGRRILYRCTGAECTFVAHVRCAQGSDMMYAAEEDEEQQRSSSIIHHPSHPEHQLLFLKRSCSFKCDACGTKGSSCSSYACTTPACEYWIHERCASLPHTIQREEHHHSLSLSFHVPPQYLRYRYLCEVCRKRLISKHWIYHCELCSYALHLTCAFTKLPHTTREKGIMEFPISDVAVGEDLIGAFLRRQGVDAHTNSLILDHQDDVDYEFHNHKLTLVSSSSSSLQEEEDEENSDDDDEEDYSCRKSELICNGCITPILVKQTSLSSSSSSSCSGSSSKDNYYYMRCSMRSCKYYLHLACFQLPTKLSSLPLLHEHDHNFLLQSGDKHKPWKETYCRVCEKSTNGLFYGCTKCDFFRVDIKCASMPDTIYHAAHPPHTLTHDATLNHPGEFYCDQCEDTMNPRSWMYHCRACDVSFHPECLITTSGYNRNMKFGQEYHVNAEIHPHPLTFQLLTTKRRCDICCSDKYEREGFYCALCNFFICFHLCGRKMIKDGNIEAVD